MLKRLWLALSRRTLSRIRWAALRFNLAQPELAYPYPELMQCRGRGRAPYLWGAYCTAFVAKELGIKRISMIEFGVAAGGGLLELEEIAAAAERDTGVTVDVYGFDTGTGLTKPQDYRDLPQLWSEGDYGMDHDALRARLQRAQLILGPVEDTIADFIASQPAPVGFVSFDLDLYSSTMDAFNLFDAPEDLLMPRVYCYFDDIIGYSHSDFNGERLAISEFNQAHEMRKLSPIYGLRPVLGATGAWAEMMYLFHDFQHSRYNDFDGTNRLTEIPIG